MLQQGKHSTLIIGLGEKSYELFIDPGLTERENQILSMITLSDKMIAHLLNISIRTVINHSVNIRRKTGCQSKGELVRYATQNQIVN